MPIPFAVPECRIESVVEQDPDRVVIKVRRSGTSGRCPDCGHASRSVHSRYHRHPADLPLSTSQTTLSVEVRRFYCLTPSCRRRTFAEPLSALVEPRARRTRRLGEAQGRVGVGLRRRGRCPPAEAPAHADEPRHRAAPCQNHADARPSPVHVGVDDWAMKKGRRYGTIVVDLDHRRVVDLLPDRTAATLAGWLERRAGIRIVKAAIEAAGATRMFLPSYSPTSTRSN